MQAITNTTIDTNVHNILICKMIYSKSVFTVRSDEPIAEIIKPVQLFSLLLMYLFQ